MPSNPARWLGVSARKLTEFEEPESPAEQGNRQQLYEFGEISRRLEE
jgi:hypothetical protein